MFDFKKARLIAAASASLALFTLSLASQPAAVPGNFTLIDAPGAGEDSGQGTTPRDINDNGEITGFFKDADSALHGFVRQKDGTYATFDAPGATKGPGLGTSPQSIGNNGDVVGFYVTNPDAVRHGFVRHKDGTFTIIDPTGSLGTVVQSVNGQGEFTGNYVPGDAAHGFVGNKDGVFTPFDPPNSYNSAPQSINESGEIAGYYADVNDGLHGFVLHRDGKFETFEAPNASTRQGAGTYAMHINSFGEIAGYYTSGAYQGLHGFIRHKDGTFVEIDPPGAIKDNAAHKDQDGYLVRPVTGPMGITTDGSVAGYFGDDVGISHGFVRQKDGVFSIFDAPHASKDSSGGTLPQAINNAGDVVGYFFSDPDAVIHGFLLKRSAGVAVMPAAKAPAKKSP